MKLWRKWVKGDRMERILKDLQVKRENKETTGYQYSFWMISIFIVANIGYFKVKVIQLDCGKGTRGDENAPIIYPTARSVLMDGPSCCVLNLSLCTQQDHTFHETLQTNDWAWQVDLNGTPWMGNFELKIPHQLCRTVLGLHCRIKFSFLLSFLFLLPSFSLLHRGEICIPVAWLSVPLAVTVHFH